MFHGIRVYMEEEHCFDKGSILWCWALMLLCMIFYRLQLVLEHRVFLPVSDLWLPGIVDKLSINSKKEIPGSGASHLTNHRTCWKPQLCQQSHPRAKLHGLKCPLQAPHPNFQLEFRMVAKTRDTSQRYHWQLSICSHKFYIQRPHQLWLSNKTNSAWAW